MQYLGNYAEDYSDLNFKFSTHKADGTPITLAGTPALSVYKSNSTTQSTAGITLTVDFDSVTGLHNCKIDLSADAFYAAGNDYSVVITTGTVNSISVVGTVLAHFSIENRNIKANMTQIIGSSLTETSSGYLAAAFKKLFDVAAPVLTAASINQGADNNVILSSGTYGNAALKTLIDLLATAANQTTLLNAVNAITTSTARSAPRVPVFMPRPASGSAVYLVEIYLYDLKGNLEDADSSAVTMSASA